MNSPALAAVSDAPLAKLVLFSRKPELWVLVLLIAFFNVPLLTGSLTHSMIFLPAAVRDGEWWRLLTHPFVHVTWYHLLLDGVAFLALYGGLLERSLWRRLVVMTAAGAGSALSAYAAAPAVSTGGLCGLSGVAHGLMVFSAWELITHPALPLRERRLGWLCFILVVGKGALEAWNGRMFFTFLHFGLMGDPIAVSHAGGIMGGLIASLFFQPSQTRMSPSEP